MADAPPPLPPSPPPGPRRLRWPTVAIVVLALALVGALLVAADQRRAASDRRDRLEALERRLARLERAAPTTAPDGDGPPDLVEDLLGRLGGGDGGLADQLGEVTSRCLAALTGDGLGAGGLGRLFGAGGSEEVTVADVATAVQDARRLTFRSVPQPHYLSPDELARRAASFVDVYPAAEAAADSRALVALGALPAGADMKALLAQALAGQVVGFYDTDTKELVVASSQGDKLDGTAKVTLSHELEHALADQALGFPPVLEDPVPPEGREDAANAAVALVEGDATLTMQRYSLGHLSLADQLSVLGGALGSQADLSDLPHYVQASLVFPYAEGLGFVCDLYQEGGWPAVDRAYAQPPTTTAQVLFPERYRAGEAAVDPADPGSPGPGWAQLDAQTFGAADLLWLLQAPGGRTEAALPRARQRVAAWAGGELRVWGRGEATAVGVALVQRRGEDGLCDTVRRWLRAAFPRSRPAPTRGNEAAVADGTDADAVVVCRGNDVRLGVGPDLDVARSLAG